MATMRVKNVSGSDREVPTPDGRVVTVAAGHSEEFDTDHARAMLQQPDVWAKYESRADKTEKDG